MSVIPIPMQTKVPDVYTSVLYNGENLDALAEWVEEVSCGDFGVEVASGPSGEQPSLVDQHPYRMAYDEPFSAGDYIVADPSGYLLVYSEKTLLEKFAPTNATIKVFNYNKEQ